MDVVTTKLRAVLDNLPSFDERAVLFALIAGWIVGWVWYAIAGQLWRASLGEGQKMMFSPRRQIVSAMSQVVMTIVLAMLIPRLWPLSPVGGLKTAGLIWVGFVLPTVLVNYSNLGARLTVTLIDGIHWLLVLLAMGAVIGLVSAPPAVLTTPAPAAATAPAATTGSATTSATTAPSTAAPATTAPATTTTAPAAPAAPSTTTTTGSGG